MTIVEASPDGGTVKEEIDILDHSSLITDMVRSDKLSLEERAKKARKNRREQLKLFTMYDRAAREADQGSDRKVKIRFPHDITLMDAAAKGAVDDMRQLLKNGMDPNACNQEGLTALHNSCIDGNPDMVKLLLEHGASVNVSDKDGWTPLHAAATCGYPKVVKILLSAEAELLALNGDGDMAYDIAEEEETLGIIEDAMRKKGITNEIIQEKRTELHETIRADAKILIDQNEDLDVPVNEEGATLLHVAIANFFNDVVEVLLDNGASVDVQDIDGWKPVHAAAFFSNSDALEMLVTKKGADLRATTDSGLEPLDLADQPTLRKNILTLMDADPSKYKAEEKKPIERGSTTPSALYELAEASSLDDGTLDTNIDTILPIVGESTDDSEVELLKSLENLEGGNELLPVLTRVESISKKRSSIREAKKQAPTIKNTNFSRSKDSIEAYDNSYDLLLTKKKSEQSKDSTKDESNDYNIHPIQTLGKIYEDDNHEIEVIHPSSTEAYSEPENHENVPVVANLLKSNDEPSVSYETEANDKQLKISSAYDNLLKNSSRTEKTLPNRALPASEISPKSEVEPKRLPNSLLGKEIPSKNDVTTCSETESTSSSQANAFLAELKRVIKPITAVSQDDKHHTTSLHENSGPNKTVNENNAPSTFVNGKTAQTNSSLEKDQSRNPQNGRNAPMSLYENDPPTSSLYENALPSTSLYESDPPTSSLYENALPTSSLYENDPPTSSLYENALPSTSLYGSPTTSVSLNQIGQQTPPLYENIPSAPQSLYENVPAVSSSHKNTDTVKPKEKIQPSKTLPQKEEPLYAVVDRNKKKLKDSIKPQEKEGKLQISESNSARTAKASTATTDGVSSSKTSDTPKDERNSNSRTELSKEDTRRRSSSSNSISASPPVLRRKKFEPLQDKRARSTEPARPGTLQDLKLKRQKSRQTLLLDDDDDLSPVISRGLQSMAFRGMEDGSRSASLTYRPPDSPTRHRKVYKAPEYSKDVSIIKKNKRCHIM